VQRRLSILGAAERTFDEFGYAATTMEAVAERADISKGNIYNYFRSKQVLFTEVLNQTAAKGLYELEQLVKSDMPAAQKMQRIIEGWFSRCAAHARIGRLMLEFWAAAAREDADGEMLKVFQDMYARFRNLLMAVVEQGFREGTFRTRVGAPMAASLIMSVVDGIMVQAVLGLMKVEQSLLEWLKRAVIVALMDDESIPLSLGLQVDQPRMPERKDDGVRA
jgi:AcrR family transcriptional regulator